MVPRCAEKQSALDAASAFARQTEQSEGVRLRLDKSLVGNEPDIWRIRTFVAGNLDAWLIVRKVDCAADWQELLYQM